MLLDNESSTVVQFLNCHVEHGELDIVSAYFSVFALAYMKEHLNQPRHIRMVLTHLAKKEAELNERIYPLLSETADFSAILQLSAKARQAIEFLEQDKVQVNTIKNRFCHAKAYIYSDSDARKNFYVLGSSNLTEAGLGITPSPNIELNTASTGLSNDFKEISAWFEALWKNFSQAIIESEKYGFISFKHYLIELIKNLYREYSPEELYYKILYELFKNDVLAASADPEFRREVAHLEETRIYNALYPFQKRGVLSLIRMLQNYGGAILADAVGLGKTWTALAVMKYFEMKGYTVLLLCPKKLANNWAQYQPGRQSRFEKDEIEFYIRFHTDLQEGRFDRYTDKSLRYFATRPKLLIVIDESHNLRNDKSGRYQFLVKELLTPEDKSRDVKVLQLSATPINTSLLDLRNQFKLLARGQNDGFRDTALEIENLESLFRMAQEVYARWSEKTERTVADLIAQLPRRFEKLTDALVLARTREMIKDDCPELGFPEKQKPENLFLAQENIGELKNFQAILDALSVNMTAYRPADYIEGIPPKSVLEDEKQRQRFLVRMMYILLVKRLESSWFSFKKTVENILQHHRIALDKVNLYLSSRQDAELEEELTEEDVEDLNGEAESGLKIPDAELQSLTLGKKRPIRLSEITHLKTFQTHLEADILKLQYLQDQLNQFSREVELNPGRDVKLTQLLKIVKDKTQLPNPRVLIFTEYADTAEYLFEQFRKAGLSNLAMVTGSGVRTDQSSPSDSFEDVLQRFAPYTKLYLEKDWTALYEKHLPAQPPYFHNNRWQVTQEDWLELVKKYDPETYRKLQNPLHILIATDCLSEGQNLQDCDLLINYDIHWNPVRLIQRMGRIDRLGSPNPTIRGINFWPTASLEEYLDLKNRVENRLAAMTLVGSELQGDLTPELQEMMRENPLLSRQAQKMLEQLQITWDDVETGEETLGLNDLSLEQFRQELLDYFKRHEAALKAIPNGVYTGFTARPVPGLPPMPASVIAALGYPRRTAEKADTAYDEVYLCHLSADGLALHQARLRNHQEILAYLRLHKRDKRFVPQPIDNGEQEPLHAIASALLNWLGEQARASGEKTIINLLSGDNPVPATTPRSEEKFKPENFDLIHWFYISPTYTTEHLVPDTTA